MRFSFTPGFSRVIRNGKNGKPFKRFPNSHVVQFTWLKPGVNETQSDSLYNLSGRETRVFDRSSIKTIALCGLRAGH